MTSRERVKKAIHFQGVDRMPHFLPDGKGNDLVWFWLPKVPAPKPWTDMGDGTEQTIDAFGTLWVRPVGSGLHGEKHRYAIPDITRHEECVFPDNNDPKFYEEAGKAIERIRASDNPQYCLGVMQFASLNEGVHNLTGLDQMFLAYYEYPEQLKALIGRLAEAQRESMRKLAAIGCDGVMAYDDWGLQDRPMVGMNLFDEFFLPVYRENWALAHELGLDVWMHSCGYVIDYLPRFHEAGLNVIQMDQQENMGLENLDRVAGGKLAFWCPVDIQQTMIRGSLDDIRAYVKRMLATVGAHNGGLVSMAYSTPAAVHHTPEKIAAMCQAFREYGVYARQ